MKEQKRKRMARCRDIIFTVILLGILLNMTVLAEEKQSNVIRVAFPQADGLTMTKEDGTRYGLVVDYLNEISKYTGWEYEYIDTDGVSMLDEFADGRFDLMGGTYYIQGMEKYFGYPDYNIGYSKTILLARKDDKSIRSHDVESLNGKTIGVYERAAENIRRLKEYITFNGLDCEVKPYSYEQLSDEKNLYPYLESGEVDLILGNSSEARLNDNFMVAASFDSQAYYIVTRVEDQENLDKLNMALGKIAESRPDFAQERHEVNFADTDKADIRLNQEELSYIGTKKTVSVSMLKHYHPLSCKETDDMHDGLIYDILKEVSEFTGLEFSYIYADSYAEALGQVQQGQADMLGFYLGTEEEAMEQELSLTAPYVSMNSIVVRNKASSYPSEGLVMAAVEGQGLPAGIEASGMRVYPDTTSALEAVNKGEADFIYGLAARLEREIQRHFFSNLVPITLVNDRTNTSFAVKNTMDTELLTIMNKAVYAISDEEKSEMTDRNLISAGTAGLSLKELIYANPVMFIGVLAGLLIILAAAVILFNRSRARAAVMQSNLEKAEAESRAKGEFLSRMSHEIRTPMNAVMGLADLVSMKEDTPPEIREDLLKIRSSSRYLLDLINDILDMSRIDRGMLSIASEPFSMEHMLDKIQDMMETESKRRELEYRLEKKISHTWVTGDEIRLRQVLTNLLSNAFKFTPGKGSVILSVEEKEPCGGKAVFLFRVTDSGIGISKEDQGRIFESFEQLGANYAKSQGTGLGLPISSSIVRMMGGRLCVRSAPGEGSEFYFTIALETADQAGPPDGGRESEDVTGKKRLLEGMHILLAEDNELNAEIAVQLLEIQGAEVEWVQNGRLVLERFEKAGCYEFQIILMDIQMPEMNGLDASRAIRALKRPDAAVVPIVAMTANSFREDVEAAEEAGMSGFISKPLDIEHLYKVLSSFREGADRPVDEKYLHGC